MRLRRLSIRRLPGIDPGFELGDVAAGVNVVIGPNASGKSSVLRAVRALLYPAELKDAAVDVEGLFEDGGSDLRVTRVGNVVAWTRDGAAAAAPELPPHHLLDCYTLGVEDLSGLTGTDEEIARRLGLELLGGYDLGAVRDSGAFKLPGSGKSEADRVRRAEERLRGVLRSRAELRRDQARLAGWQRELEEAKAAAADVTAHERALALLTVRREIRDVETDLAAFPEGMGRLAGNEGERLEASQARLEQEDAKLREAREAHAEAQRAVAETGLEGRALEAAALQERRSMLQDLHRLEGDAEGLADAIAQADADVEAAEAELRAAPPESGRRDVPPSSSGASSSLPPAPRLDPATLSRVEDDLTAKRALEADRRALQRELESLPTPPEADRRPEPTEDPDSLHEGRRALSRFLSAARADRFTPRRALGLAFALAGAAAAFAVAVGGADRPLLVAAGALVLASLPLLIGAGGGAARREAAARFRATGLPDPDAWREAEVAALLERLDEMAGRASARRLALERREQVARRLAEADRELAACEEGLAAVAARVGFDARHLDAGFQRWLRLLDAADAARRRRAELRAQHRRKRQAMEALRDALTTFLRDYEEAPDSREAGASVLGQRLEALARRLSERDAAERAVRTAATDIARAEAESKRLREEIRELYTGAGLTVDATDEGVGGRPLEAGLRQRLERLPAYKETRERLANAEARRDDRARELTGRRDLLALVEEDDEAALRSALEACQARAAGRDELAEAITRTETLISEAERERALENARAERQNAAAALEDLAEATLRAEAGRFLLDTVAAEHEERSQPPALRRAAAWFRRFTRNRFELAYDSRRHPPFAAVESVSGARRLPAELSTGTRAQLLLAVRVAFALEAEAGRTSLPLFLDEALTTADAERFREVADSLATLAREDGRQLFYLTARGEDAAIWRERSRATAGGPAGNGEPDGAAGPHIIDVARLRRSAEAVVDPAALTVEPAPAVPDPDGVAPERYAELLGVPPLDPWRPPDSCHVFHLLRDALPLIRRLVEAGADRVGPLRSLLRGPAADSLLRGHERGLLARRIRGLEAFLEGWRRGRGRPVDRQALAASGAATDTFLDRVDALAADVGGDAGALLSGLADGRVPRFRNRDREALAAWLAEHGYLDDRGTLDEGALRLRVVAALAATASPEGPGDAQDALEEAQRLTAWLLAAVGSGPRGHHSRTSRSESSTKPSLR